MMIIVVYLAEKNAFYFVIVALFNFHFLSKESKNRKILNTDNNNEQQLAMIFNLFDFLKVTNTSWNIKRYLNRFSLICVD